MYKGCVRGADEGARGGQVREALAVSQADSSRTVRVRDSADGAWRELVTFPYGEEGALVDFAKDGKSALVLSSLGRETTALVRLWRT